MNQNPNPLEPQEPQVPPMPEAPQPPTPQPEVPPTPEVPQSSVSQPEIAQPQVPPMPTEAPIPQQPQPDMTTAQNQQQYHQQSQQYYQQPQQQMYSSENFTTTASGYFEGLMSLLSEPRKLINNLSQNITKAFIFIGISLGIWAGTSIITSVLRVFQMNSSAQKIADEYADKFGTEPRSVVKIELNGEFWGEQFKSIALTALYAVGFILLIAGVVYVLSLIGKKASDFNKSFGLTSILAVNFVAQAIASVVSLISLYWTDASDFISLIVTSIIGIVFVYSSVLLIQGLVEEVGLSYFVVVCSYVLTVVFGLFILGKMIKDFNFYFNVDFGSFGSGQSALLRTWDKNLNDAANQLDDYFDF